MFKLGDLVIKKTGGNKMTISKIVDRLIDCQWFVGSNLNNDTFSLSELIHIDEYYLYLKLEEREDKISKILN